MKNIVNSKVKCPRCKSCNLSLVEIWEGHSITWEQIDGKFDRSDGALEPGDAYKVNAHCSDCDHRWRVRKALQIDDIVI